MGESPDILEMVDEIYAAAADPDCWQRALDLFCAHYPEGHGTILHHDVRAGSGIFAIVSSGWCRRWVDNYNAHYARVNPWLKQLKKRPVGLAVPAEFMVDRATLTKTEFYHDFMKPQNMISGVGITVDQDHDRFVAVSVLLPERTARNERKNVELLQRLGPHFRRALQLNRQLAMAALSGTTAEAALDRLAIGFMVVDASCKAIFHNRAAGRILAAADGLSLDRGSAVVAHAAANTHALHKAVSAACAVLDSDLSSTGGAIRIGRRSGKAPYSVLVAPLRPKHAIFGANNALAAVLIADSARERALEESQLAQAFEITGAEARILRLLIDGRSVTQAGDELGISESTARTHLRNIFSKTGFSRQADLVRAVMRHPISLWDQD